METVTLSPSIGLLSRRARNLGAPWRSERRAPWRCTPRSAARYRSSAPNPVARVRMREAARGVLAFLLVFVGYAGVMYALAALGPWLWGS
ncbi:hypothetical protein [Nocardia sp. CC201C]|uniref:hypothetical protein n=1 Tax=Nocardia sp. CC201C TaxID=3044575 RepID=UPI0024A9325E|nr:hypothetical protein [Nocardia sp. CC201C]